MNFREGEIEEAVEESVHRVRPEPFGKRCRSNDVAEDDGDLLALTLDLPRELAERLRVRAIREEKNLETVSSPRCARSARRPPPRR